MPDGTLRWIKVGNAKRLRMNGRVDFGVDELSKPLRLLYDATEGQTQLDGMNVSYDVGRRGALRHVRQAGMAWEDPAPAPVQQTQVPLATAQPGGRRVQTVQFNHQGKPTGITLDNGETAASNRIQICEVAVSQGKEVSQRGGKWIRNDYSQENRYCYPFNFVRAHGGGSTSFEAGSLEERRTKLLNDSKQMDQSRYVHEFHTGYIEVELTVLTPTIVSHPVLGDRVLGDEERRLLGQTYDLARQGAEYGETNIQEEQFADRRSHRIRPSMQAAPGKFVLPASSLKGMLRSMVEAYANSFMGVISGSLKGERSEGKARMESRNDWRRGDAGVAEEEKTLYTYSWDGYIPAPPGYNHDGNWLRWVRRGDTPWDKLGHLCAERNPGATSLACRMFGRVSPREYPSWRGRVRVSSAVGWDDAGNSTVMEADSYWFLKTQTRPSGAKAKCEALYLLPTAEPCRSNTPCRSMQVACRQDLRYAYDRRREQRASTGCNTAARYCNPDSMSRGRKMYWPHSLGNMPLTTVRDILARGAVGDPGLREAVEQFKVRVTGHPKAHADTKSWVRPVLPGSTFRFRVSFDNFTKAELGALLKAIELENGAGRSLGQLTHCHRLGRAKALGFGSVGLTVTGIQLLDTNRAYGSLLPATAIWKDEVDRFAQEARDKFTKWCASWRADVWSDIEALTRMPARRTDYEYWKNFSDFNPEMNTENPLPLPQDQVQA